METGRDIEQMALSEPSILDGSWNKPNIGQKPKLGGVCFSRDFIHVTIYPKLFLVLLCLFLLVSGCFVLLLIGSYVPFVVLDQKIKMPKKFLTCTHLVLVVFIFFWKTTKIFPSSFLFFFGSLFDCPFVELSNYKKISLSFFFAFLLPSLRKNKTIKNIYACVTLIFCLL